MLFYTKFIVRKHERGLLFKDGDFQTFLAPATYRFFDPLNRYTVESFDASQPTFTHKLVDYWLTAARDEIERLFELVQTGKDDVAVVYHNDQLTAILGPNTRALYWKGVVETVVERYDLNDSLVIDKQANRQLFNHADARVKPILNHAVVVSRIDAGDMKELLAKVVEAEKAAQANVIRRREETNATRSLLNTAKVMESNTVALRLKELETLERVTENVGNLSVYGGLDGVMNGLVQLKN